MGENPPSPWLGCSKPARVPLSVKGGREGTKQHDSNTLPQPSNERCWASVLHWICIQCSVAGGGRGSQGPHAWRASAVPAGKCVAPSRRTIHLQASWLQTHQNDSFRDYCSETYAYETITVVLRGHRFESCRRRIGLPAIHCFMPDDSLIRAPCEPGF